MTFPEKVRIEALHACGRFCTLCRKYCGTKMELHHIEFRSDGGANTFDNCIPLCFDCHGDMKSYDAKHPKGSKFSPEELRLHRKTWYDLIAGGWTPPKAPESSADVERKRLRVLLQGRLLDDCAKLQSVALKGHRGFNRDTEQEFRDQLTTLWTSIEATMKTITKEWNPPRVNTSDVNLGMFSNWIQNACAGAMGSMGLVGSAARQITDEASKWEV